MVIILEFGDLFYIESHHIARGTIATTTTNTTTITLDKAGEFLGISVSVDASNTNVPNISASWSGLSAAEVSIGDSITGIEVRRRNDDTVSGRNIGVDILLFMRRPAR